MKFSFHFLFWLLILSIPAFGQVKEYDFVNFTKANGLPSNETYYSFIDRDKHLWIATDQGVVRFNGTTMKFYNLPDNVIFKMSEDRKGRLWFFSRTGKLAYYFNGTIIPFKYNSQTSKLSNLMIIDAYVDDNEIIHINSLHNNHRVYPDGRINTVKFKTYSDSNIITIHRINKSRLFTQKLQYQLTAKSKLFFVQDFTGKPGMIEIPTPGYEQQSFVHFGAVPCKDGGFWFFAGKQLIKVNPNGSSIFREMNERILCIKEKTSGIAYVGLTSNGFQLVDSLLKFVSPVYLEGKSVSSISVDNEGGTWFTTLESGVYYLKTADVYRLSVPGSVNQNILRVKVLNDSSWLFCTRDGLYINRNNLFSLVFSFNTTAISDMIIDDKKNIIISGSFYFGINRVGNVAKSMVPQFNKIILLNANSEILRYNKNKILINRAGYLTSIPTANLFSNELAFEEGHNNGMNQSLFKTGQLYYDSATGIWIGTLDNLYKFNAELQKAEIFSDSTGAFQNGVNYIRRHGEFLVAAIRFGGLAFIKNNSIAGIITKKNGLQSNFIEYILPAGNDLWVSTPVGISKVTIHSVQPFKYTIVNLGINSGLDNLNLHQLELYGNKILAPSTTGLYIIDNIQKIRSNTDEIPFQITSVKTFKGELNGVNKIRVPYNNKRIIINSSAVLFNSPGEIINYYRFPDIYKDWRINIGNELSFDNLSAGKYTLEMYVSNPLLIKQSAIRRLTIIIEGPWWQNIWFRLSMLGLILTAIYFLYKARIKNIRETEKAKSLQSERMIELEQTALRSQMNPHFIFNCLTSVQQLIMDDKKEEANEFLVKFSRLIRMTLDFSMRSGISVAEELIYLKEYMELEQFRMHDSFDFIVSVGEGIDPQKMYIPNMMIQPILENAVRHGIKYKTGGSGIIELRMSLKNDNLICEIEDNGAGRNNKNSGSVNLTQHKSYGLDILFKRLKGMGGLSHGSPMFEIEDLVADGKSAGTRITIALPVKMNL